jgi:hypothetical protein
VKDGKVAGASRVASNGGFAVAGLESGIHSVIGVGRDGIFALGIEVLPFKAADKREDAVPVSLLASMEVAVAPVTAQNINAGNFSSFFGQAPGTAPGVQVPQKLLPAVLLHLLRTLGPHQVQALPVPVPVPVSAAPLVVSVVLSQADSPVRSVVQCSEMVEVQQARPHPP